MSCPRLTARLAKDPMTAKHFSFQFRDIPRILWSLKGTFLALVVLITSALYYSLYLE